MSVHSTCGLIITAELKRPFQELPEEKNQVIATEIRSVSAAPAGARRARMSWSLADDALKGVMPLLPHHFSVSDSRRPHGLQPPGPSVHGIF